jgi:hypothetical protein
LVCADDIAVQHLKEADSLNGKPQDIHKLAQELDKDLEAEYKGIWLIYVL